jgi:host factor-I protein
MESVAHARQTAKPGGHARDEVSIEKQAQNIQEAFLNNARKDKSFLTIYLMSGVKLSGRIKSFDKYSVVLESNNQEQLIFKHAISTVVFSRPFHGGNSSHAPTAAASGSGAGSATGAATHAAPGVPVGDNH